MSNSESAVERAERLFVEGKLEDARVLLECARSIPEQRVRALSDLGVIAARDGDVELALGWFEAALAEDPFARVALLNLFDLLEPLGRSAYAEPFLTRAAPALGADAEIEERIALLASRCAESRPSADPLPERVERAARSGSPLVEHTRQRLRALIAPGDSVLELGCGDGAATVFIRSLGVQDLLGVDRSQQRIASARRTHPGVEFRVADALELDCGRSFDFIVLGEWAARVPSERRTRLFEVLAHHSHPQTLVWTSLPDPGWLGADQGVVGMAELLHCAQRCGFRLVSFASFGVDAPFERGEYLWARSASYAKRVGLSP